MEDDCRRPGLRAKIPTMSAGIVKEETGSTSEAYKARPERRFRLPGTRRADAGAPQRPPARRGGSAGGPPSPGGRGELLARFRPRSRPSQRSGGPLLLLLGSEAGSFDVP